MIVTLTCTRCQFFHEVAETEPWMVDEVSELSKCLDSLSLETINQEDAKTVEALLQVRALLCRDI